MKSLFFSFVFLLVSSFSFAKNVNVEFKSKKVIASEQKEVVLKYYFSPNNIEIFYGDSIVIANQTESVMHAYSLSKEKPNKKSFELRDLAPSRQAKVFFGDGNDNSAAHPECSSNKDSNGRVTCYWVFVEEGDKLLLEDAIHPNAQLNIEIED